MSLLLLFNQAAATVAPFIGGQSADPVSVQSFQFDDLAQPFPQPAQFQALAKSYVTDYFPRRGIAPYQRATAFVPLTSVPSTTVYVSGQSVDPFTVQSFQCPTLALPVPIGGGGVPETITLDKWHPRPPDPRNKARRLTTYGVNTAIAKQEDISMEWAEQPALPRRHKPKLQDYSFRSFDTTLNVPANPQVRISGQSVDPIVRQSFQYESLTYTLQALAAAPETLTLDKWFQPTQIPVRRRSVLIDPRSAFVKVAPFGDLITLDKWLRYQPTQFPKPKRIEGQFRFHVIPILTIPPSSAPAVWRNEATISLFAADLQSLGINPQDVTSISIMPVSLDSVSVRYENSALVTLTTKDDQSISILYEDVRTI